MKFTDLSELHAQTKMINRKLDELQTDVNRLFEVSNMQLTKALWSRPGRGPSVTEMEAARDHAIAIDRHREEMRDRLAQLMEFTDSLQGRLAANIESRRLG